MRLESSKQGLIMLRAFHEAGQTGITYIRLAGKMAELGNQIFGEEIYVNIPVPLNTLISNASRDNEIVASDTGRWTITDKGEKTYRFLEVHRQATSKTASH